MREMHTETLIGAGDVLSGSELRQGELRITGSTKRLFNYERSGMRNRSTPESSKAGGSLA